MRAYYNGRARGTPLSRKKVTQTRPLGRTPLRVSEIGFGAWGLSGVQWIGATEGESLKALHRALDRGVNLIDTALAYGDGTSEQVIGRALQERKRDDVIVATKVPPKNRIWPASGRASEVFPPEHVSVTVYGNVLAATALLYGLASTELRRDELDTRDPDYEVLIAVRAVKPRP